MKIAFLKEKALWVRRETLKVHGCAPETRLASSLSDIEIFTALYYGKILNINPKKPEWEKRDRLIVSKAHGAISMYPILADLGYFKRDELERVCMDNSMLGSIPDCIIPGFETMNGSLGHGPGVACGIALALKRKKLDSKVFVLVGDGELNEGSVWEAVMFASHHKLDNLILIVDDNKISMLDYQKKIMDIQPLEEKFRVFGWKVKSVDGHNVKDVYSALKNLKKDRAARPKVLIADTRKGKGVPQLESDCLCHIKSLNKSEVETILRELK